MTNEELSNLKNECSKKYEEYCRLNDEFKREFISTKYGQYIGKYVVCLIEDDGFPNGTYYAFIKDINYTPYKSTHIRIFGVMFEDQTLYNDKDEVHRKRFTFNSDTVMDVHMSDVKFELISEQEFKDRFNECVSDMNGYVLNTL